MSKVCPPPSHYSLSYAPSIHPLPPLFTPSLHFLLLACHTYVVDPRLAVRQLNHSDGDLSSWWWRKL